MYLLEPNHYESLKAAQMTMNNGQPANDIQVNKLNQSLVQNRIYERNESGKKWQEYGKNLKPIITEGIKESSSASPDASLGEESDIDSQMVKIIAESVPRNFTAKATRLYSLLRTVDGIQITPDKIVVDDKPLFGLPAKHIAELCRGTRYLSFDCTALLNKIKDIPQITELIANKQAKSILDSFNTFATSTPIRKSTPINKKNLSESTRASDVFYSGEDLTFDEPNDLTLRESNKKKKKKGKGYSTVSLKKKKPSWHSLFS